MASTYSYVNPAVAVLLGGAFGEPFGIREGMAMALILLGLYVLNRSETTVSKPAERLPTECAAAEG